MGLNEFHLLVFVFARGCWENVNGPQGCCPLFPWGASLQGNGEESSFQGDLWCAGPVSTGGGMPFIATPGQEGSAPLSDKSVDLIMGHVNQIVKLPLFLIN